MQDPQEFEVVGLVSHNAGATGAPPPAVDFDPDHIVRAAATHEAAGFDRVLIANTAVMPDSMTIASYVAANTTRLKMMVAHRPGFIAPTMASRIFGTLDRLSRGRVGVHIIAGADDREVQADGAFNTKAERYTAAAEYVEVMRKAWSSAEPFDFDGEVYHFRGAASQVRPAGGAIPVFWGGTSDQAIDLAGRCADVYALGGDTLGGIGELVSKAYVAAHRHQRRIGVLMTMVVMVGETRAAAWDRAHQLLERVHASLGQGHRGIATDHDDLNKAPAAQGFRRLMERAEEGDCLDTCLWTGLNKAYRGRGNNSVLVGDPNDIVDALMAYRRLGVTRFLLRGPDPLADAERIGRDIIPLLRRRVAEEPPEALSRSVAV